MTIKFKWIFVTRLQNQFGFMVAFCKFFMYFSYSSRKDKKDYSQPLSPAICSNVCIAYFSFLSLNFVVNHVAFASILGAIQLTLLGLQKSMADIEVKASENVMEACARTSSVRSCVLTSSLLACIWQDKSRGDLSSLVNHACWSDESVCIEKKVLPPSCFGFSSINLKCDEVKLLEVYICQSRLQRTSGLKC